MQKRTLALYVKLSVTQIVPPYLFPVPTAWLPLVCVTQILAVLHARHSSALLSDMEAVLGCNVWRPSHCMLLALINHSKWVWVQHPFKNLL